jgi:hypothetical protein
VLAEGNEAAEVVEEGIDGLLGRRMRRHGGYMVGEDGSLLGDWCRRLWSGALFGDSLLSVSLMDRILLPRRLIGHDLVEEGVVIVYFFDSSLVV